MHDHVDGHAGGRQDRQRDARLGARRDDRRRRHGVRALRVGVGTVGRAGDGSGAVRAGDGRRDRRGVSSRCGSRPSADCRRCSARSIRARSRCSPTSTTPRSCSPCSSYRSRYSGGRCGIRAPSREAGATSRSGSSRRRTSDTRSAPPSGSTSRTTRCGRGRGSSSRSARCSSFPSLADIQRALPHVNPALIGNDLAYPAMLTLLPAGMKGLLVASLFAAYRSTMETHLNWGSSYLIIDFYQRFIGRGKIGTTLLVGVARADRVSHDRGRRVHAVALHGERGVPTAAVRRRGDGAHLPAALVLVAHQRVERDLGDGVVVHHRVRFFRGEEGRLRDRRPGAAAHHGRRDDGRVGDRHDAHRAGRPRVARAILRADASRRARAGTRFAPSRTCRRRATAFRKCCSAGRRA